MTRTGIKLDLDVGDFVSHAGQAHSAISKITEAMKKAETAKDYNTYAKLAYEKGRTQTRAVGFDRNMSTLATRFQGVGANGQPVFKIDQRYADLITRQIDVMKKLNDSYLTALNSGKTDEVMSLSSQIAKEQSEFHKIVEKATGMGDKGNTEKYVKSIFGDHIASAINSGLQLWVSSRDRTGVINALGSGDVMGAQLAESQRRTNMTTGSIDIGGSIAQALLTFSPLPGGAAIGAGAKVATNAISAYLRSNQAERGNKVVSAELWENQTDQAMNLAALRGDPTNIRGATGAWRTGADVAEKYGYSAEEGMEALKQAAYQGLSGNTVDNVFKYERATGADRGALASFSLMSERYGGGDVLAAAWRGLQASGMKTGQLNELLRGMERTVADGISKGYIRSTDQIARNLTMLSEMTGGNELWKGEQGVQRLSEMNSGLEKTVGLKSSSEMLAFRAAQRVLRKDNPNARYEDILALQERGISDKEHGTEFLREIMKEAKTVENGDRSGIVEILRDLFGWNYNKAIEFYDSYKRSGYNMSDTELNIRLANTKALPKVGPGEIPELKAKVESMNIRNMTIKGGQLHWDKEIWKAFIEARRKHQSETEGSRTDIPAGTRDNITYYRGIIDNAFFGRGGDASWDATAMGQFHNIWDSANDDKKNEIFSRLDRVNNSDRKDWDDNDLLNRITNANNAQAFLDKLDQLIRLYENSEKNMTAIDIINEIR